METENQSSFILPMPQDFPSGIADEDIFGGVTMQRILVVEDDFDIQELLQRCTKGT